MSTHCGPFGCEERVDTLPVEMIVPSLALALLLQITQTRDGRRLRIGQMGILVFVGCTAILLLLEDIPSKT